ncbi:MAG: Stealth CR1 domain-containing protein, partial [Campylobacterota bacterium]|nr:Stealth CR1 domain-containing protein [Campylobacterota bacterium]
MNSEIDAVITWVDGSDLAWKRELDSFKPPTIGDESKMQKFRDWDTLRYIFRGIEEFMPWIRKIHFVTAGHLPKWIDTSNPKLNIVTHSDIFENRSDLPTFNSNSIEFNFLNIDDLSEQFIYFNDDMLVLKPTAQERMFMNGKPRDYLIQTIPRRGWIYYKFFSNVAWRYNLNNNVALINRHFSKKESIKKYRELYYNDTYSISANIKNRISNLFRKYHYFEHYHQAQPFLKSVWEEATLACKDEIDMTISQRFRERSGVTAYLFRYWHLVSGHFVPHNEKDFIIRNLQNIDNIKEIANLLKEKRFRFVCLNDESFEMDNEEFIQGKKIINEALDRVLPLPSSYEKSSSNLIPEP